MANQKWTEVQKRVTSIRDAAGNAVRREESDCWYGRMKVNAKWKWFKLYTDKRASQQRWAEIIREQEQRDAGIITPQMDAARLPLSQHLADYLASLQRIVSIEHYRIAKGMLDRFIALAEWKSLSDVNERSASRVLSLLGAQGKTVAYANQYLARVKAFLNWCIPERLIVSPLVKLKRGNVRKALKKRARRPLAEHEISKLLATCPSDRRLKYAFPLYTGLRRKELEDVRWGDLHMDSVIPFLQLRPEQTKTGDATALPLHPFVAGELRKVTPGMPGALLFAFLPEGRTLLRDLERAGLQQTDATGRRADFHALRHTFAKRLDEHGCSHANRKALMRHSSGDQTDGYTLARLSDLYDAVKRLPHPDESAGEVQVRTGTDGILLPEKLDTHRTQAGHGGSSRVAINNPTMGGLNRSILRGKQGFIADGHPLSSTGLLAPENRDTVAEIGPRSSVG